MAGTPKRRAPQHLVDERGIALVKRKIPENWVLREYRPDYGPDFAVEVFEGEGLELEFPRFRGRLRACRFQPFSGIPFVVDG